MHLMSQKLATSAASSTSTFRNTTSGYLSDSSLKKGAMLWQGPHHVAVKSTTTSLSPASTRASSKPS
uniref:Uncharacterized protein n=1 Tax=Anguilla anguilla TaxID=7936 RepID=A0A0E9XAG0_ANGAN